MATLVNDSQVLAFENEYTLGSVWQSATDAEQISAANTTEGIWRGLEWIVNPFDSADTFTEIRYHYAASCRFVVENDGSLSAVNTNIRDLLRRYIHAGPGEGTAKARPLGTPTSTSSTTSPGTNPTLTGSQIAALLDTFLGSQDWREGDGGVTPGGASDFGDLTGVIASAQIPDDIIVRRMFGDNAVGSTELGVSSVINTKIADGSVGANHLNVLAPAIDGQILSWNEQQSHMEWINTSQGGMGLSGQELVNEIDETLGNDDWQGHTIIPHVDVLPTSVGDPLVWLTHDYLDATTRSDISVAVATLQNARIGYSDGTVFPEGGTTTPDGGAMVAIWAATGLTTNYVPTMIAFDTRAHANNVSRVRFENQEHEVGTVQRFNGAWSREIVNNNAIHSPMFDLNIKRNDGSWLYTSGTGTTFEAGLYEWTGTKYEKLSASTFTMVADQSAAEAMPSDDGVFYYWNE